MTQMKKNRLNMKKDSQLCEKISEKYLPIGLETTIPQNLLEFCKDLTGINKSVGVDDNNLSVIFLL